MKRPRLAVAALRGRVLRDAMTRLGATFIKLGQVMSTRPELFDRELIDSPLRRERTARASEVTMNCLRLAAPALVIASLAALGAPACGSSDTSTPTDAGTPGADSSGNGPPGGDAAASDAPGNPLPGVDAAAARDGSSPNPGSPAAALAAKLGRPSRLLFGLGGGNDPAVIKTQGIAPDLYERYLVSVGAGAWPTWNSPSGAYVNLVAGDADTMGAVPMFTLYQMATNGDGNIADINDATFMGQYWANVQLLFQRLAIYGKPALVNFEPDFWGYTEQASPGGDPTKLAAKVSFFADCAALPDSVAGLARCMVTIARKYAPKAYVGFSPSTWGASTLPPVVDFLKAIGGAETDFVVMQTLDRDSGCFEAAKEADCMRSGTGWYWDEANVAHPNFQDHLAEAKAFSQGLNLPLVWWQTPLGAPSATPGGTPNHYRDNRAHYFLTHPAEVVAAGGLGIVFGAGASNETDITTDNGQMKTLSTAYLASPAPLK